jgi:hypothetical protein
MKSLSRVHPDDISVSCLADRSVTDEDVPEEHAIETNAKEATASSSTREFFYRRPPEMGFSESGSFFQDPPRMPADAEVTSAGDGGFSPFSPTIPGSTSKRAADASPGRKQDRFKEKMHLRVARGSQVQSSSMHRSSVSFESPVRSTDSITCTIQEGIKEDDEDDEADDPEGTGSALSDSERSERKEKAKKKWGKFKSWFAKGKVERVVNSFKRERVIEFHNQTMTTHHLTLKDLFAECTKVFLRDQQERLVIAAKSRTPKTPKTPKREPKTPKSKSGRLLPSSTANVASPRRRTAARRRSSVLSSPQVSGMHGSGMHMGPNSSMMAVAAHRGAERRASVRRASSAQAELKPDQPHQHAEHHPAQPSRPSMKPSGPSSSFYSPQGARQAGRPSTFVPRTPTSGTPSSKPSLGGLHRTSSRRRTSMWGPGAVQATASRYAAPAPTSAFKEKPLHIRDLRLISPISNSSVRPAIAVRKQVIVLKLEHIRACILHDTVFLMGIDEGDHALTDEMMQQFLSKFCVNVQLLPGQVFEHYALEVLLDSVSDKLTSDLTQIKVEAESIKKMSSSKQGALSPMLLDTLRRLLMRLSGLYARGEEVCQALAGVLDDVENVGMMCLSSSGKQEEIESLLEMSWQGINNVNHEVMQLSNTLGEEQIAFQLKIDYFSNRFVWSSFTFRIINLVFTFGAMWTAILGMNVSTGTAGWDPADREEFLWRKDDGVFAWTSGALCLGCTALCLITFYCVSRAYVG